MLDHGAHKVTVSEIARAAGVGKGTVYLYWPAKEDLILGLFARTTPSAMCETVMPIHHRHGLIPHDRPLPELTYAAHAVLTGFGVALSDPATAVFGVDDPDQVLADTVARLLEPPVAPSEQAIAAAAEETLAVLRQVREAVLELIERSQILQQ